MTQHKRTQLTTALSIIVCVDACAWLIGVPPTLYYALTHRSWPTLFGIRLLAGPFEALGIDALIVSGIAYVIVNGLKLMSAYWLWNSRRDGAVLALILLGLSTIFWYGFALPLGPLLGLAQAVLVALTWRSLR
jgi:hypothetical protein